MDENQNKLNTTQPAEETGIDFMQLFRTLLKHKKTYYKVLGITFVVACIYALSIPKTYQCEVMLAPELSTSGSRSSLSALAASFGMKLGSGAMGSEALFPTLYPDLMNSVDFKTSLFPITVHKKDSTRLMTYYDYLLNEQKLPWWSAAVSDGLEALVTLIAGEDTTSQSAIANPFQLTKKQARIIKKLKKKIVCDVDKKTMVITIQVNDQDPWIAATMADSVKERLQDFITDYRTSKARKDLEYNRKLYKETKQRYEKARQLYAEFADANQDIILQTVRQRQTDLENEMQLQYNAYTQIAAQMLAAEAKVQEETPAFTTLQSATVPLIPEAPKKKKIVLVFLFLAFLCTSVYILHKEDQLKPLLGLT